MCSSSARKFPSCCVQGLIGSYGCSFDHSVVKHQRNDLADTAEGSRDDLGLFHHHKWHLSPQPRSLIQCWLLKFRGLLLLSFATNNYQKTFSTESRYGIFSGDLN